MAEIDNTENSRAKLNPVHAKFYQNSEATSVPLTDTKEVRVMWDYSTEQEYSELENFLQAYTWPSNTGPQRYVTDPEIAGEKLEGTWRQAFISRIPRETQSGTSDMWIVLTLRRGWAQELKWDEARIAQGISAQGNDQTVGTFASDDKTGLKQIVFPGVSPFKASDLILGVGESITGQKVQTQTLEGLWYINVARADEQDDGSATLTLTVAQDKYVLNSYRDYGFIRSSMLAYAYNVPKKLAQPLLDELKLAGYSATIAYNKNSEVVDITSSQYVYNSKEISSFKSSINCDSTSYTEIFLGEEDETAHQIPEPVPAGTSCRRSVQERFGAYDIVIVCEVRNKREYAEYLASIGLLSKSEVTQKFGIIATEDDTVLGAAVQGEVTTLQRRIHRDCSRDEVKTTITDLPDTSAEFVSNDSALATNEEIIYRNQTAPVVHPEAQAVGRVISTSNTETRSGLFNAKVSKSESKALPTVDKVSLTSFRYNEEHSEYRNASSVPLADAYIQGVLSRTSWRVNQFGQYDGTKVNRVANTEIPDEDFTSQTSLAADTDTSLKTNQATIPDATAASQGVRDRVAGSQNEWGFFDVRQDTTTSKPQDLNIPKSSDTLYRSTETDVFTAAAAIPVPAAALEGQTVQLSAGIGPDGTYSGTTALRTKEGHAWTFTYLTGKNDGFEYTIKHYGFLEVTKDDVDTIVAALDSDWGNSVNVACDDTGRYSGSIVSRDLQGNGTYAWWWGDVSEELEWEESRVYGHPNVTHYVGVGIFSLKSAAQSFLDTVPAGSKAVLAGGSSLNFHRVGFRVVRIREALVMP